MDFVYVFVKVTRNRLLLKPVTNVFECLNMTRGNYRNRLKLSINFHISDSNDTQL